LRDRGGWTERKPERRDALRFLYRSLSDKSFELIISTGYGTDLLGSGGVS
jgi:hypothetical protein